MARATTKTGIANLSLSLIKNDPVSSIDPPDPRSKAAKIAALWYDEARRETLSQHDWDFAKARVNLSAGDAPTFGWANSFQLPADCLRISAIGDERHPFTSDYFTIEGDKILINEPGPLQLLYIRDEEDITKFTPRFLASFAMRLSGYISAGLTGSLTMAMGLLDKGDEKLSDAQTLESQQRPPRKISRSRWAAARQRGHVDRRD